MPAQRYLVQEEISALSECLKEFRGQERPGIMNYTISKLIQEVYGDKLNYFQYSEIIGLLDCCKMEFYRAQVAPYEELKRKENGNV